MSEPDYPEDIIAAAEAVVDEIRDHPHVEFMGVIAGPAAVEIVAGAIAAAEQRGARRKFEACLGVAMGYVWFDSLGPASEFQKGGSATAEAIATEILGDANA